MPNTEKKGRSGFGRSARGSGAGWALRLGGEDDAVVAAGHPGGVAVGFRAAGRLAEDVGQLRPGGRGHLVAVLDRVGAVGHGRHHDVGEAGAGVQIHAQVAGRVVRIGAGAVFVRVVRPVAIEIAQGVGGVVGGEAEGDFIRIGQAVAVEVGQRHVGQERVHRVAGRSQVGEDQPELRAGVGGPGHRGEGDDLRARGADLEGHQDGVAVPPVAEGRRVAGDDGGVGEGAAGGRDLAHGPHHEGGRDQPDEARGLGVDRPEDVGDGAEVFAFVFQPGVGDAQALAGAAGEVAAVEAPLEGERRVERGGVGAEGGNAVADGGRVGRHPHLHGARMLGDARGDEHGEGRVRTLDAAGGAEDDDAIRPGLVELHVGQRKRRAGRAGDAVGVQLPEIGEGRRAADFDAEAGAAADDGEGVRRRAGHDGQLAAGMRHEFFG